LTDLVPFSSVHFGTASVLRLRPGSQPEAALGYWPKVERRRCPLWEVTMRPLWPADRIVDRVHPRFLWCGTCLTSKLARQYAAVGHYPTCRNSP